MLSHFATAFVFVIVAVGFAGALIAVSRLLAPRVPSSDKSLPYECGEVPTGTPWIRLNPRYYKTALVFIVFDVELALIYPVAVVFRSFVDRGMAWPAVAGLFLFLLILIAGLAYVWKKGDLDWIGPSAEETAID